jgi:hypothetical protein
MKKFFIAIVIVAILAPLTAYAFSFSDVLNFSKNIFHKEAKQSAEEVKNEMAAAPDQFSSYMAVRKYNNWKKAFDQKDISVVFSDSRNFYFTDDEINYLISKQLADMSNPPAHDVQISFEENLIKISGVSMLKYLSGEFYLEAKAVQSKGRIDFKVTKAQYRKTSFPAFIAELFLRQEMKSSLDFLYSSPDYQSLSVTVGNGFIQLNYGQ